MAGLSSNVMNMKFMQKATKNSEDQKKQDQIKKVKDNSEWVLPNRTLVQQNIKKPVLVQTVGYGSIATLMLEKKSEKEDKSEKKEEPSQASLIGPKDEAKQFLDSIVSLTKKRSKTLDNSKKKKKPKRH